MNHFEKFESYIPIPLMQWNGFILAMFILSGFIVFRYFLMVFSMKGLFAILLHRQKAHSLHDGRLKAGQVSREIYWSLVSTAIFAFSGWLLGVLWETHHSQIYLRFDTYGWCYLLVSPLILALVHEVYFYWTHRTMHHPLIYKYVHKVHHESDKVTPWASFSFHPIECVVHSAFLPLMVLWLPLHPTVIIFYLSLMTVSAIVNHSGLSLRIGLYHRYFVGGEHHQKHHRFYNGNYGLYFTFSDILFGTDLEEKQMVYVRKGVSI